MVIETKTKGKDNFALGSDFGQPEILTCGAEGETLINETEEQGEKMVPSYIPVAVSCSVIKIKLEQLWDEEYYGICKFCIPQSLQ